MILNKHDLENDNQADNHAVYEAAKEAATERMADDFFEAYMSDNQSVIDEIDEILWSQDADNLLANLRQNFTNDGMTLRAAYMRHISDCCMAVAKRYSDIESAYKEWNL